MSRTKGGERDALGFATPVSAGMRRWYLRLPKCRRCRKVYLILEDRRQAGICTKCAEQETPES